jgi:putative membrane protein
MWHLSILKPASLKPASLKPVIRAFFIFCFLLFDADNAVAQWGRYGDHPMGSGMMGGMGWFGAIVMIIFWVLVIVGLVLLIRWLLINTRVPSSESKPPSSALEILRERYARGEIDKKEFEEKKKDLLS